MLLTAGFMAMATLLSKVLGLVRDSLLTAYFGSGLESDAFLTASTIPTTLFDVIIGGVISAAFIPVFNDIMSKKGKDEAMKFVNKFVTLIVCITLFIVVGGIIFRDVLVNIQAPNYTADKHNLAAQLTAIMFPMMSAEGSQFSRLSGFCRLLLSELTLRSLDRKSTRLNSSHRHTSRMPSSA